jgi:GT2 family glycosyltransferase
MFSYVINHYAPADGGEHLAASTAFAASLALRSELVAEVLVVDGSPRPDTSLQSRLEGTKTTYLHLGAPLSFAEGYNAGLERASQEWVALSASDVYLNPSFLSEAKQLIESEPESIGCVVPRLSISALPAQQSSFFSKHAVRLPLMTLNLNVFNVEYVKSIGGIPDDFSGNYNDVLLSFRISRDRRQILMTKSRCVHYGSLTLSSGSTTTSLTKDRELWRLRYSDRFSPRALWQVDASALVHSRPRRVLLAAAQLLPARLARVVSGPLMMAPHRRHSSKKVLARSTSSAPPGSLATSADAN